MFFKLITFIVTIEQLSILIGIMLLISLIDMLVKRKESMSFK
jgi:hypothetical protein